MENSVKFLGLFCLDLFNSGQRQNDLLGLFHKTYNGDHRLEVLNFEGLYQQCNLGGGVLTF